MANSCSNILTITGPKKEFSQAHKLLSQNATIEEVAKAYKIELGR